MDSENDSFDGYFEVDVEADCLFEFSSQFNQFDELSQAYAFQPQYAEEKLQHQDRSSTSVEEVKK